MSAKVTPITAARVARARPRHDLPAYSAAGTRSACEQAAGMCTGAADCPDTQCTGHPQAEPDAEPFNGGGLLAKLFMAYLLGLALLLLAPWLTWYWLTR